MWITQDLESTMTTKKRPSPAVRLDPMADLAAWRTHKGITLEQVIETTKICRRYLVSIEAGNFRELPGGIFTLSWLRQYTEAVGLNAEDLLREYRQKTESKPVSAAGNLSSAEPRGLLGRFFRIPA